MSHYQWCDGSGCVNITLTQAQIDSVCQSGPNDAAVAALPVPKLNAEDVRAALSEYGGWDDEELGDDVQNLQRILWIACWDCRDDPELYKE